MKSRIVLKTVYLLFYTQISEINGLWLKDENDSISLISLSSLSYKIELCVIFPLYYTLP